METCSALLALCLSPVTGEFPSQWPVTRSFYFFFDLRLNKRLSKQSWGWWFETPSRSLWRHCNAQTCPRALVTTKTSAYGMGLPTSLGPCFNIAWQLMITTFNLNALCCILSSFLWLDLVQICNIKQQQSKALLPFRWPKWASKTLFQHQKNVNKYTWVPSQLGAIKHDNASIIAVTEAGH